MASSVGVLVAPAWRVDVVVGVLGAVAVERAGVRFGWWREREPAEGDTG